MLIPRLLADGHEVRALARDPQRVDAALASQLRRTTPRGRPEAALQPGSGGVDDEGSDDHTAAVLGVEVVGGDLLTGRGLTRALDGIDVSYYLVHSMETPGRRGPQVAGSGSQSLRAREHQAAARFGRSAARAGVGRIVYLGGLVPDGWTPSRHLASRAGVETVLMDAVEDTVALRASIVIAARSRSFRLLVHLVERLPVIALPPWRRFRTQPIDGRDLISMLASAATVSMPGGSVIDVAGPDVVSYGQMLERIAEAMLVRRPRFRLRVSGTPVSARVAAALAGEDPALTLALMEGLRGDLLPATSAGHAAAIFGVDLHSFDGALEHALREWETVEPLAAR